MKISEVAAYMRENLALARNLQRPAAYIERELPRGLSIIHGYTEAGNHYLVMRREGVYPSPVEVQTVCEAFGLQYESLLPDHYRRPDRQRITGRPLVWHCVRVQWRETDRQPHFGPGTLFTAPCEA